jgi:hypothetical protein
MSFAGKTEACDPLSEISEDSDNSETLTRPQPFLSLARLLNLKGFVKRPTCRTLARFLRYRHRPYQGRMIGNVTMARTVSMLVWVLAASFFSLDAQAFPSLLAPQVAASDFIQVRGFCGLGAHRGPYGYCVPNGVVVVAPPAYYVAPPVALMPSVVCPYAYYYYAPYGRCVPTP